MHDPKLESVKTRIRKMLALADDDSASQGEVENALQFVDRLMTKHHLRREDLTEAEREEIYARQTAYTTGKRVTNWEASLVGIVGDVAGVGAYIDRSQNIRRSPAGLVVFDDGGNPVESVGIVFYGPEEDVAIAYELFDATSRVIAIMARLRWGGVYRGKGRSYCEGFVRGIRERIRAERSADPETSALAVRRADAIARVLSKSESWLSRTHGINLTTSRRSSANRNDRHAYGEGRVDGREHGLADAPRRRGRIDDDRRSLPN